MRVWYPLRTYRLVESHLNDDFTVMMSMLQYSKCFQRSCHHPTYRLILFFISRNPFLAVVVICVAVPQTTTTTTTTSTTTTTVKIPLQEITTASPTTKTKAEVSAPGKSCTCNTLIQSGPDLICCKVTV